MNVVARARIGALLALLFGSGCYSYIPADFSTVPMGEGVRVYLSETGMTRLRELGGDALPGAGTRPIVSGRLVNRTPSEFSLEIPVGTRAVGFHTEELDQRLTLPVADVVQVEMKKVSGVKTAALTAAGAGAIGYLIVLVVKGARDPVIDTQPDPDNIRIPLFSLPVR